MLTTFAPLVVYMAAMSITPGPNNIMLLASGVNFGLRRTVPHMLGIAFGFAVEVFAMGMGLGALFVSLPMLHDILRWAGLAYLLWLAWRIVGQTSIGDAQAARPIGFFAAALFQWVNPKAVVMAATTATLFMPGGLDLWWAASLVAAVSVAVNLPCISVWAAFGTAMRRVLGRPPIRRAFNGAMALALVATGLWMAAT